jgi:hypothetical protein
MRIRLCVVTQRLKIFSFSKKWFEVKKEQLHQLQLSYINFTASELVKLVVLFMQ